MRRFRLKTLMLAIAVVACVLSTPALIHRAIDHRRHVEREMDRQRALKTIATGRHSSALKCYEILYKKVLKGEQPLREAYDWSLIALRSELEIGQNRLAAFKAHRRRMAKLKTELQGAWGTRCEDGTILNLLNYYVEEAEYWIAREQ